MKKLYLLAACLCLACLGTNAQETLFDSKSLVGIWSHVIQFKAPTGDTVEMPSGNFKIYNVDSTFMSMFIANGKGKINMTGKYKQLSENEIEEHIAVQKVQSKMNNSVTKMEYYLMEDNNVMLLKYYNEAFKRWIPEKWIRVTLPQTPEGVIDPQEKTKKL